MAYIPHTERDVREMLAEVGAKSLDDLFRDIPEELLLKEPINLPSQDEYSVEGYFRARAAENNPWPASKSFIGAGAYRHFIPAAAPYIVSRGEFMTSYTPYQAEVSQGTLQSIFEFQSHICALTAMEAANASMYDGATALAEALSMAIRVKRTPVVYLPQWLHPDYRATCEAFLRGLDVDIRTIPGQGSQTGFAALFETVEKASAVVVATPNCLGTIEEAAAARELAERAGALLVACCNPTSLAILAPPGEYGADIAVGEAQPLGIPLSFGGPYAGFLACRKAHIRRMPGRVVGKTTDGGGREGFVLTLQTREQHIRRDKATSNICTNQGLFALMATVYMTLLGREGLEEVAGTSLLRTNQLADALEREGLAERWDPGSPTFHECALRLPVPADDFRRGMKAGHGILPGFALHNWFPDLEDADRLLLVNCTELITEEDISNYTSAARQVLAGRLEEVSQ